MFKGLSFRIAAINPALHKESCTLQVRSLIYYNAILILTLWLVSGLSLFYASVSLGFSIIPSLIIGSIGSTIMINIIRFGLTIGIRNTLPEVSSKYSGFISKLLRYGFVFFLSILFIKPLEHFVIKHVLPFTELKQAMDSHILDSREEAKKRFLLYEQEQLDELSIAIQTYTEGAPVKAHPLLKETIAKKEALIKIMEERTEVYQTMWEEGSTFLLELKAIQLHAPWIWLISCLLAFIYLLPLINQHRVFQDTSFFIHQKKKNRILIKTSYTTFKETYTSILYESTGQYIQFSERFEDPPFNTIPKADGNTYLTLKDFREIIVPEDGTVEDHRIH